MTLRLGGRMDEPKLASTLKEQADLVKLEVDSRFVVLMALLAE